MRFDVLAAIGGRLDPSACGIPDAVEGVADIKPLLREYEVDVREGRIIAHHTARFTMGGKTRIIGDSTLVACEGAQIHGATFQITGRGNLVVIGPNARLRKVAVVVSGDNCLFVFGADSTWETGSANVTDGKVMAFGRDCMLSSNVALRNADGHGVFDRNTRQRIGLPADVVVGDHVWIGNGSRVSKGVRIGSGSIIGQMSLVTKDVAENTVAAGVPAREVRRDIAWSRTLDYADIPIEFQ